MVDAFPLSDQISQHCDNALNLIAAEDDQQDEEDKVDMEGTENTIGENEPVEPLKEKPLRKELKRQLRLIQTAEDFTGMKTEDLQAMGATGLAPVSYLITRKCSKQALILIRDCSTVPVCKKEKNNNLLYFFCKHIELSKNSSHWDRNSLLLEYLLSHYRNDLYKAVPSGKTPVGAACKYMRSKSLELFLGFLGTDLLKTLKTIDKKSICKKMSRFSFESFINWREACSGLSFDAFWKKSAMAFISSKENDKNRFDFHVCLLKLWLDRIDDGLVMMPEGLLQSKANAAKCLSKINYTRYHIAVSQNVVSTKGCYFTAWNLFLRDDESSGDRTLLFWFELDLKILAKNRKPYELLSGSLLRIAYIIDYPDSGSLYFKEYED